MLIYGPYRGTGAAKPAPVAPAPSQAAALNFHDVLRRESGVGATTIAPPQTEGEGLRFSKHAEDRLMQRGIFLDAPALQRLEAAVEKAAAKGSGNSVVLMDGSAFIVSVAPKTVVTVMDVEQMHEKVISNIDSFVWAGP